MHILFSPSDISVTEPSCLEFELRLTNITYFSQDQSRFRRLADTSVVVYQGNVEICINGTYVAICDLGWDDVEAQLACNSVGYSEPFFRKLRDLLY